MLHVKHISAPFRFFAWIALLGLCLSAMPDLSGQRAAPRLKVPWQPDQGDGTYKNPVLFADYSDPDVIRSGGDFYLIASSFNCAPGLPILHSRDLVNWRILSHVFQEQPPAEVFCRPQHGNGVWAPTIRLHNGEFYIFYGDPDFGIYMAKAQHPAGPWSAPLLIKPAKGWIDPCPFWDDDSKAYLIRAWARSRSGIQSILTLHRMSPDGTKLLDEGTPVFDGLPNHPTMEGPKLYKRNGYYYIFAPAGGVTRGWQTVLRSKAIYGPYENRIVMDQGKTEINGPHQGAWVELKSGESWFLHFQDRGAYGRIVHLQPMKWVDDWPVIGADPDGDGKGEPVLAHKKPEVGKSSPVAVPQTSDEFATRQLGLQWQWHANFEQRWFSLSARRGWLRLAAMPMPEGAANLWRVPNLLLQKFPAPAFSVTTRLDFARLALGEKAGLLIMGMDYSYLAVERTGAGFRLRKVSNKNAHESGAERQDVDTELAGDGVYLRVQVSEGALCSFSFSTDGRKYVSAGAPFAARAGRWIGAKVGLFSLGRAGATQRGYAEFDWFRLE
jgi:beta-xylosidase